MSIPKSFRDFGRAIFVLAEDTGGGPDEFVPLAGAQIQIGSADAAAIGTILYGASQRNNVSYEQANIDRIGLTTLSNPGDRYGVNALSVLYAADSGFTVRRLLCDTAGRLEVNAGQSQADAIITQADQSVGTGSATQIAAANASRRTIIVQNLDGTNFIRVGDSNVSASRGIVVAAGESITLENTAAVYAIADTAAVNVAVLENDVTP